jgi:hypothetical protein
MMMIAHTFCAAMELSVYLSLCVSGKFVVLSGTGTRAKTCTHGVKMEVGGVSLAREEAGAAAEAQCEGTVCGTKRQGSSTRHAVTQSHVDDEVQPHELVDAAIV